MSRGYLCLSSLCLFLCGSTLGAESIFWKIDLPSAMAEAKTNRKLLMVEVYSEDCVFCQQMETDCFSDPAVVKEAQRFVPVRLNIDKSQGAAEFAKKYDVKKYPTICFLVWNGYLLNKVVGLETAATLVDAMTKAPTPTVSAVDSGIVSLACNAVRSPSKSDWETFLRFIKSKGFELEDIYFDINCDYETRGVLFVYANNVDAVKYFLSYLRYREQKTGRTLLDPILNKTYPEFTSGREDRPNTLLDVLNCIRASSKDDTGVSKLLSDLIDTYRSYGAKYYAELSSSGVVEEN